MFHRCALFLVLLAAQGANAAPELRSGDKACKGWKSTDDPTKYCRQLAEKKGGHEGRVQGCGHTTGPLVEVECIKGEKNCLIDRISLVRCDISCGATKDYPRRKYIVLFANANPEQDSDLDISIWHPTAATKFVPTPTTRFVFDGEERHEGLHNSGAQPVCRGAWTVIEPFLDIYPPASTGPVPTPMFKVSFFGGLKSKPKGNEPKTSAPDCWFQPCVGEELYPGQCNWMFDMYRACKALGGPTVVSGGSGNPPIRGPAADAAAAAGLAAPHSCNRPCSDRKPAVPYKEGDCAIVDGAWRCK